MDIDSKEFVTMELKAINEHLKEIKEIDEQNKMFAKATNRDYKSILQ